MYTYFICVAPAKVQQKIGTDKAQVCNYTANAQKTQNGVYIYGSLMD